MIKIFRNINKTNTVRKFVTFKIHINWMSTSRYEVGKRINSRVEFSRPN